MCHGGVSLTGVVHDDSDGGAGFDKSASSWTLKENEIGRARRSTRVLLHRYQANPRYLVVG
jgi:hypothetical protein